MGDVAGIGPEVALAAALESEVRRRCQPLLVGHPEVLRRAAACLERSVEIVEVAGPDEARDGAKFECGSANSCDAADTSDLATRGDGPAAGRIATTTAANAPLPCPALPCCQAMADDVLDVRPGSIDPRAGRGAYDALMAAARWALEGRVDAVTTAPLSKAALWQAGHHYPGHTELLAEICGVDKFAMMLYLAPGERVAGQAGLGVAHVTLHVALRDVFAGLTGTAIVEKAGLLAQMMAALGAGPRPRLGIAALNPHAGEEGLFGDEEARIIAPAVRAARAKGIDATGPLPADTLMVRAARGEFDGVVAMYHDQGHIALKLLGIDRAVNVTLGLPIVRTSVAHGTAYDIAWQGRARHQSMIEALGVATRLVHARAAAGAG